MPLVVKIDQLKQMDPGAVPEAFKGKVKSQRSRWVDPKDAAKSLEKVIITDETGEIEVVFSDREPLGKKVGAMLYVCAATGDKGKYGTKRKDNDYQKKITPQVWVYNGADVSFEGGSTTAEDLRNQDQRREPANDRRAEPPPERRQESRQPAQTERREPAPASSLLSKRLDQIELFNKRLGRNMAGLLRCYDAAFEIARMVDEKHVKVGGFRPSASDLKEIASNLFIQTSWDNKCGDNEDFPTRPFDYYTAKAAETPKASPQNSNPPPTRSGAPDWAGEGQD